jgi:xanthine dehydrogenase accessory factor
MNQEIFSTLNELASRGTSFAIATVIETEGSSSAQTGSKALIDSKAKVILGWVGGGCVENVVRQEAMESITDGKTRIVTVDLTDEILGVGMPCGGKMRVFIEPVLPPPRLVIAGRGRIAETVAQFAHRAGFSVTVADPGATLEDFPTADRLAKVGFSSSEIDIGPETYVVVATQHKGDHLSLKRAIECGAAYIGLVASKTRAQLVFDYLAEIGISRNRVDQAKVRAPAGIDIGAKTPEEVALSIVSEMVQVRRGGSGRSMQDAKGIRLNNETGSDRQTGRGPDASTSANGSKNSSAWHPSFP